MSNQIRLKRGSGSDPSASDLVVGEVALRTDNGKLFTKKDDNSIAEIGTGLSDGDKGDITISNSGGTFTIDNGAVTSAKILDGTIVNADINASAAIAGTKIDPDFGSQGITTTGVISMGNGLTLTGTNPFIDIIDSNNNSDFTIKNDNGTFEIEDKTNSNAVRLAINSSGNVGIGTTSPSYRLSVEAASGTDVTALFKSDDANAWIQIRDNTTTDTGVMVGANGDNLLLRAGSNERMRITSAGKVGIGTIPSGTPANKNAFLAIGDSDTGIVQDGDGQFEIFANAVEVANFNAIDGYTSSKNITTTGNVGIGTTSPSGLLHIEGSSNGTETYGRFSTGPNSGDQNLYIQSGSSRSHMALQVKTGGGVNDDLSLNPSGGNVGIGTTSPSYKLDILEATGNGLRIKAGDATADIALSVGSAGTADKFVIQAGGNVGIGTTSPSEKLHINSATTVNGLLISTTNNNTRATMGLNGKDSSGNQVDLRLGGFGDTNRGEIFTFTNHDIGFATNNAAPQMVLNTSGKVGIGTTSPTGLLHLKSSSVETILKIESESANDAMVFIDTSDGTGANADVRFARDGSTKGRISFLNAGGTQGDMRFTTGSDSEAMRIDSSGRLLIGDTSSDNSTSMLQIKRANNNTIRLANSDATATNFVALDLCPANSLIGARIVATADGTFSSSSAEDAHLKFFTTADGTSSERMRILSGGGLTFNGDTTQDNALDDYEQGTWTPTATGFTIAHNYSANYTKIGNVVYIQMYIEASGGTGVSAVSVGGLPYTVKAGNYYSYAAGRIGGSASAGNDKVFEFINSSTTVQPRVADGPINEGMISGQHLIMSGFYHVA